MTMSKSFQDKQLLSKAEVGTRFKDMPCLASFGEGVHKNELYYFRPMDVYFETVPLGKTGEICFRVRDLRTEADVAAWMEQAETRWRENPPPVVTEIQTPGFLQPGQLFDVAEIETKFPKMKLIKETDDDSWSTSLHLIEELDLVLEKGPFARWDTVAYRISATGSKQ